jgi:hypothetical protein
MLGWARRLLDTWLEDATKALARRAALAESGLAAPVASGPQETPYQKARRVLAARYRAAGAVLGAPVTEDEWEGRT